MSAPNRESYLEVKEWMTWHDGEDGHWVRRPIAVKDLGDALGLKTTIIEIVPSDPTMDSYGEWRQQEPHIESPVIEPARCRLPVGRYLVIPLENE